MPSRPDWRPEFTAVAGSRWQPWISIPANNSTFAATMVHTTILNRSRRIRCRSACGEPGALNGFSVFILFPIYSSSSAGCQRGGEPGNRLNQRDFQRTAGPWNLPGLASEKNLPCNSCTACMLPSCKPPGLGFRARLFSSPPMPSVSDGLRVGVNALPTISRLPRPAPWLFPGFEVALGWL